MKRKPETTSPRVASKAGKLMRDIDSEIEAIRQRQGHVTSVLDGAIETLKQAKSIAASALTQREKES